MTDRAGSAFERASVGRGAAFGDIDNDGDVAVVVGNDNGRVELLINEIGNRSDWIGLRLVGGKRRSTDAGRVEPVEARDMLGARVGVIRAGSRTLWRRARSDGSSQSSSDPRVSVIWPGGRVEEWPGLPINRYTTLNEGSGVAVAEAIGK